MQPARLAAAARRSLLRPADAIARSYSADERATIGLLTLPLFLMAFVIAASQATRTSGFSDLIASREPPVVFRPEDASMVRRNAIEALPRIALAPTPPTAGPELRAPGFGPALLPGTPSESLEPVIARLRLRELPATGEHELVPGAEKSFDHTVADQGLSQIAPVAGQPLNPAAPPIASPSLPLTGGIEVAALDLGSAPSVPAEASVDPDGKPAAAEPAMCVAGADARMTRVAALGPAVPSADPEAFGLALAAAARDQLDDFTIYTDKYHRMSYPMGDVPSLYGVCTDVVVRAYRAVGLDLQALVHQARVGSGDTNIDHRRVETLRRFFAKYGESLPITEFAEDFRPGDVVSYYRPQNRHSRTHIAIVSDVVGASGRPMIIHNRGWGPQQEDALFVDQITGHYRYSGARLPPGYAAGASGEHANGSGGKPRGKKSTAVVKASYPADETETGTKSVSR